MKISKTKYFKFFPIVLVIFLFALQACSNTGVSGRIDNQGLDAEGTAEYKQELGVKSANQILESMESVTRLSRDDNNSRLKNFFGTVKASMPSSNEISSLGPSQINAIHNLSFEFCDSIMDFASNRQRFFEGTDFENSSSLNSADRVSLLANILVDKACGPQVVQTAERAEMINVLIDLTNELQGMGLNETNTIRGVCTSVLSSACVTQF